MSEFISDVRDEKSLTSRLSYQTFLEYLEWLENQGLVKVAASDDGNKRIMLSEKGMETPKRLVEWIKEMMRDVKISSCNSLREV